MLLSALATNFSNAAPANDDIYSSDVPLTEAEKRSFAGTKVAAFNSSIESSIISVFIAKGQESNLTVEMIRAVLLRKFSQAFDPSNSVSLPIEFFVHQDGRTNSDVTVFVNGVPVSPEGVGSVMSLMGAVRAADEVADVFRAVHILPLLDYGAEFRPSAEISVLSKEIYPIHVMDEGQNVLVEARNSAVETMQISVIVAAGTNKADAAKRDAMKLAEGLLAPGQTPEVFFAINPKDPDDVRYAYAVGTKVRGPYTFEQAEQQLQYIKDLWSLEYIGVDAMEALHENRED